MLPHIDCSALASGSKPLESEVAAHLSPGTPANAQPIGRKLERTNPAESPLMPGRPRQLAVPGCETRLCLSRRSANRQNSSFRTLEEMLFDAESSEAGKLFESACPKV